MYYFFYLHSSDPILDSMLLNSDDILRIKTDLIWYNDCLYRNRARFAYMTWLDIDEVFQDY